MLLTLRPLLPISVFVLLGWWWYTVRKRRHSDKCRYESLPDVESSDEQRGPPSTADTDNQERRAVEQEAVAIVSAPATRETGSHWCSPPDEGEEEGSAAWRHKALNTNRNISVSEVSQLNASPDLSHAPLASCPVNDGSTPSSEREITVRPEPEGETSEDRTSLVKERQLPEVEKGGFTSGGDPTTRTSEEDHPRAESDPVSLHSSSSMTTPPPEGLASSSMTTPPPEGLTSSRMTTPPPEGLTSSRMTTPPPEGLASSSMTTPPPEGLASSSMATPPPEGLASSSMTTQPSDGLTSSSMTTSPPEGLVVGPSSCLERAEESLVSEDFGERQEMEKLSARLVEEVICAASVEVQSVGSLQGGKEPTHSPERLSTVLPTENGSQPETADRVQTDTTKSQSPIEHLLEATPTSWTGVSSPPALQTEERNESTKIPQETESSDFTTDTAAEEPSGPSALQAAVASEYRKDTADDSTVSGTSRDQSEDFPTGIALRNEAHTAGERDSTLGPPGAAVNGFKGESQDTSVQPKDSPTSPVTYWDIEVPVRLVGRLIGKQGKYLAFLRQNTGAKFHISALPYTQDYKMCRIEGSEEEVERALALIKKKLKDLDLTNRHRGAQSPAPLPSLPHTSWLLLPPEGSVEVIVPCVETGNYLFVQQHTHPTFHTLHSLVQQMSLCYSRPDCPALPTPVEAGVVCAAPSAAGGWWRAQVIKYYRDSGEVQIRYVDYGGYVTVKIDILRQIRSDFVTLPFQGAEVMLENIAPLPGEREFTQEAKTALEELTKGVSLVLEVTGSECGLPLVHMWRPEGEELVSVNRTLVERGLCAWTGGD
ncbi:A-kinase anchor protein 1, mitochondrial [Chanos chanos]|uniref:A-kinase anchor protein 1, mitochondrial n=1 Tax=Chanos chanos TaxID=29144 RepID=A0A6J2WV46_CHACN|nr:A-kinase anchor protein 1, mitochondrial-like [Chanos chanos]